jgi:hypothetical protein
MPMDVTTFTEKDRKELEYGGNIITLSWACNDKKCMLIPPSILCNKDRCVKFTLDSINKGFESYANYLQDCSESSRMTVIPLSLKSKISGGHENVLIFDKKFGTLERFDPNGTTNLDYEPEELDIALEKTFKNILKMPHLSYIKPMEYCPVIGPQMYETQCRKKYPTTLKKGFCTIWSFLYANLRLSKPDISRENLVKFMINEMTQKRDGYEYALKILQKMYIFSERLSASKNVDETREIILDTVKEKLF